MALTQQEFNQLLTIQTLISNLRTSVHKLGGLATNVIVHADPADPLNADMTFSRIVQLYGPAYTQIKSDIQSAFNALP